MVDKNTSATLNKLPTNKRNWVYAVCCMTTMFIWTDEFTFSSTTPYWSEHFGFNAVQIASVASAYTLTYACAQIYGGMIGDKIGAKRTILLCIVGVAICCLGILVCTGYITMVLRNLIFGAFFGLFWGPCNKLMANWLPAKERGSKSGIWGTLCTACQVYATPLALFIAQHIDWRMAFVVVTILMIPLFCFVLSITNDPADMKNISQEELDYILAGRDADKEARLEKMSFKELGKVLSHGTVWVAMFACVLASASTWMSAVWISNILLKGYGVEATKASFMIAPMSLIPVVAGLTINVVLAKVLRGNIKLLFVIPSTIGTICFLLPTFVDMSPFIFTLVIVGFGVIGNSYGFGGGNMYFGTYVKPKYQGTLNGMAAGIQGLVGFVMTNLSGHWVTDMNASDGYNKVFLYTGLFWILGIILGLACKTRHMHQTWEDGGIAD